MRFLDILSIHFSLKNCTFGGLFEWGFKKIFFSLADLLTACCAPSLFCSVAWDLFSTSSNILFVAQLSTTFLHAVIAALGVNSGCTLYVSLLNTCLAKLSFQVIFQFYTLRHYWKLLPSQCSEWESVCACVYVCVYLPFQLSVGLLVSSQGSQAHSQCSNRCLPQ